MPEASADFRTWTVRLQPGILFTDDPAFGGRPRELTAADYAYSLRRLADPAIRSPGWSTAEQIGIRGLAARRRESLERRQAFDYERPLEGLQVLDRYTLQFRLDAGRPRFAQWLASAATAAVAREVIEAHGELSMQHPVGTGPFRLAEWRRASRIVLERNPLPRAALRRRAGGRRRRGPGHPGAAAGAAAADDRPRGDLHHRREAADLAGLPERRVRLVELPRASSPSPCPAAGWRRTWHAAASGPSAWCMPSTYYTMFNMDAPGGRWLHARRWRCGAPSAWRSTCGARSTSAPGRGGARAVAGAAVHLSGYDPAWRSEMSEYNPARARALLDLYGYIDRDGDGWRERPTAARSCWRWPRSPARRRAASTT
jgi:ABC-type transport system substrate-binding protein